MSRPTRTLPRPSARRIAPRAAAALAAVLAVVLAGCEEQSMATQPKLKPYSAAKAFENDAAARAIPAGTVSRDAPARLAALTERPVADAALLQGGRQQYEIYCTPCHGRAGRGDGIVVKRGFPAPPSYLEPRLLAADAAHVVDVITHGWGVMYPYAARVAPRDRWAIAAYVRALQVAGTGRPADRAEAPAKRAEAREGER